MNSKMLCSVYYYSLAHILHLSFPTGYFPDILKIAKIQPMVKKGDEKIMKNYKNIRILFFSKILLKLTFNRLNSFVQKCNILTDAQHGFNGNRFSFFLYKIC